MTKVGKVALWYLGFYILLSAAWYYTSLWVFGKFYFSEEWTLPAISVGAMLTSLYVVSSLNKRKQGKTDGEK